MKIQFKDTAPNDYQRSTATKKKVLVNTPDLFQKMLEQALGGVKDEQRIY